MRTDCLTCCSSAALFLAASLTLALPARAQDSAQAPTASPGAPVTAPLPGAADEALPAGSLSLEAFLAMVDRAYPRLLAAEAERRVASARLLERQGAFDPVYTGINEYLRVQSIVTAGVPKDAVHNESRVDLLTRSGIRYFAAMRLNPNDAKTPFVPSGRAGEYSAGFTIPLLRGLRMNERLALEQQAILGEPLAAEIFRVTRLDTLLRAAAAYWEWVGSKARVDIAARILELAQARLSLVRERVAEGDLPALDIAEAEQELQRRQALLDRALREYQKAALALSVFLWNEDGTERTVPPFQEVPPLVTAPRRVSDQEFRQGTQTALELRPELKRIALEREQAKVDLRLAENMLLPEVNGYFAQGADTGRDGIGPVVRAGVTMAVPLRQRTARGQIQAAQLRIQRLTLDERAERQRISAEVADTISAINTAFDRYQATLLELERARQVERGERIRFEAGDSTLFLVNLRERATAEAEMRLVEVHVEHLQAIAAFRAVTAQI